MKKLEKVIKSKIAILLGNRLLQTAARILCDPRIKGTGYSRIQSRPTIETLNQIMDQSDSLREFLHDESAKESYFLAVQEYFGKDRFSRRSFRAILSQLDYLDKHLPEVGKRIWSKTLPNEKDFEISIPSKTHGRNVNHLLWKAQRNNWISQLESMASEFINDELQASFILTSTINKIMNFEKTLSEVPSTQKKKMISRNSFYTELRKDSKLQAVASLFLYKYLRSPNRKVFFELSDADSILEFLKNLRQFPRTVLSSNFQGPIPSAFFSIIRELVPDPKALLKNESIFPVRYVYTKRGRVIAEGAGRVATFKTILVRPFHAIWTGIPERDCMGGDPSHLNLLTPERWALPVIRGTLTHFLERNGKYKGVSRAIPVQHRGGEVFGNLEVWMPLLANNIKMSELQHKFSDTTQEQTHALFNVWIKYYLKTIPSDWGGLIVSESDEIDNSRVKDSIRRSPVYVNGKKVGEPSDFDFTDPLAFAICQVCNAMNPQINRSDERLVCDATMKDARKLTLLQPETRFSEFSEQTWDENGSDRACC